MRPSSATISAAIHGAAVLILLFLFHTDRVLPRPAPVRNHFIQLVRTPTARQHEAGGGQREQLRASKGQLPPRATQRMFVPPTANILNQHPKLPVEQAIVLDQPAPDVRLNVVGDPYAKDGPLSGGRGGPGGIGDGACCGVGNGRGPGLEGAKPITVAMHRSLIRPVLIYKVDPEYSDEARKAKHQGVVVLVAEVDGNGRTRNMRVVQPLGLGLDEKAIAAASQWRFRPAIADGRPVSYPVTIEVNFRLL